MASKALLPPPAKWEGLSDVELRYRQRYVDLWANPQVMNVLKVRMRVVEEIRRFMSGRGYLEVETPMMQVLAGGAAAKPFVTHHNALDIPLFMRIAPELYLKRLLVGGFEKVYELNRNFRNEGVSTRHNPEFTMLEFYWAYADVNRMMDFCEELIRAAAQAVGQMKARFGNLEFDFSQPFRRVTMRESVAGSGREDVPADQLIDLFEEVAEPKLMQPTFITDFPKVISPLSKASPNDASVAERFELYIAGMEVGNGFSELNDPVEQYERFNDQMKERER